MGYYTGSGVVTGGGSSPSIFEHFVWMGSHNVYQLTDATTVKRNGVSLATAQAEKGNTNMQDYRFTYGSSWYVAMNCKGTRKIVSYSQIGGSNLYELTVTTETVKAKLDSGGWVS